MTEQEMKQIADMVAAKVIICSKEVLTVREVALYLDLSMSYLYKLTMTGDIPHFKPNGKVCYFNRVEVEQWAQRNRVKSSEEISHMANNYCNSNPTAL